MLRRLAIAATLALSAAGTQAQTGEMNLLTDLGTPFPPGCLAINVPVDPGPNHDLLVNTNVAVPTVNSSSRDGTVHLRIWRVACADDEFSVVLVSMRQIDGNGPIVVPQVFADAGEVLTPFHQAQLLKIPGAGNVGASGNIITESGDTWMLAVQPQSIDGQTTFLPEDYNERITVELNWGAYSTADTEGRRFVLDRFEPLVDAPQFDEPLLNGRYSGQWVLPGAPRQGLFLTIGEQIDANFVFAIFFTYLDGEPYWVVGNTAPELAEPGPVTIQMQTLDNGAFITDPNQPPSSAIGVDNVGSIEIEVIDCNNLRVDYDFSPLGKGNGTMELERLARVAGYDCNPWR